MYTIQRTNEHGEVYETTKSTVELAQTEARQWMNYWKSTTVYYTNCPTLIIFEAGQFIITKETK